MSANRNYYILTKSFGHFFKSSILIALAELLCQVVDLALVGNLINPDAFSALDLALPIETAITGLMMLMTGGAGVIACKHIGNQDFELADRIQTMAVISTAVLAAVLGIFGLVFLPGIVGALSSAPSLSLYLTEYLRVYFLGLVPMALYFSLAQIVDIDGSPMVVTRAVILACILDVLLDVFFMKYLGCGVAGQAIATIVSYVFPVVWFIPYIHGKRCRYRFRFRRGGNLDILKKNLAQGIPYCLPNLITFFFGLIVNTVILNRYGTSGLYVWGVIYQVLVVGFMILDYCGRTVLITLGSMLYGCYDSDGIEILIRRMLQAVTVAVMILVTLVFLTPGPLLKIFGSDPSEIGRNAFEYMKISVLFLFPFTYCSIKSYVFQILGRKVSASLEMPIFIGLTVLSVALWPWADPSQLGICMLAAFAVYYVGDVLYSLICRHRDPDLSAIFLVPHKDMHKLYISVPLSMEGMNEALPQVEEFLDGCRIGDTLKYGVNLCCEELMLGLVTHNPDTEDESYFDFLIYEEDGDIKVRVQDAGEPFNPVRNFTKTAADSYLEGEEMHLSLQIINRVCQKLDYNYLYGQNTIYMLFNY